jgi:uncharacterized protein (TIGR02922 family)
MEDFQKKRVTVIYYSDTSLELLHKIELFLQSPEGRVVIPESFKQGKSIIAVCDGEINILNKIGDRIISAYDVA